MQKGDIMRIFGNKRGIVTHPLMLFFFGVAVGLVLAYLWINYITIPNPFC